MHERKFDYFQLRCGENAYIFIPEFFELLQRNILSISLRNIWSRLLLIYYRFLSRILSLHEFLHSKNIFVQFSSKKLSCRFQWCNFKKNWLPTSFISVPKIVNKAQQEQWKMRRQMRWLEMKVVKKMRVQWI